MYFFQYFPDYSKMYHIEVELVFTVNNIYKKFMDNDFYQYFTEKYEIKTSSVIFINIKNYQN